MNRCLRARSGTHSGFLSPPAPRGVNGSGQSLQRTSKSRVIFKPLSDFDPSMLKAGDAPAFSMLGSKSLRGLKITRDLDVRWRLWPDPFTPRGAGGLRNPECVPDRALRQRFIVSHSSWACG